MKIGCNELRIGTLIEHNGRLLTVTKTQHVKPGKGGAFVQAELKDIKDGTKMNERFRSDTTIERVRLDEEECQMLFCNGDIYTFMNMATYDQVEISKDLIGESACFLKENMVVKISMYEEEIIGVVLPNTVIMEIIDAEPVVKAQTAASSYKPAVLENGVRIMVPPHIEIGTKVVVNTEDISYVERAK